MKKILLSIITLTTVLAGAQNVFQDSFSSYNSNVQLSGQGSWTNNSSLPGGGGAAVTGGSNANIITNTLSYLSYGTSNNSLEIKPNADGCGAPFTAVTSGNLYVGFVLNLSVAQANNNSDFFRILSGSNYNTSCRIYATPAGGSFFVGTAKGANGNTISFSSNSYNYNQDHLIIIKYTQNSGTNDDVVSVFVDPVYANGEPINPTITTSAGNDQSGNIDRLSFRQNWTNGMPTGFVGLVSVAHTWETLTFLPLAIQQFNSSNFVVTSNEANQGILSIKSNVALENETLNIYDIQGKKIDTKTISLQESVNNVAINPIRNTGVYIVEIVSESNQRFTQKILVK